MNKELSGGIIGTILSVTGTAIQPNEVLQTISLILTIIGSAISLIIIPLITWYKNAKKDGKIDKEEISDGLDTLQEGIKGVKDIVDNKKKGDND